MLILVQNTGAQVRTPYSESSDPPSTSTMCIPRLYHAMRQFYPGQCSCPLTLTASRESRSLARNEKLRLAFGFIQNGILWKARRMSREPVIHISLVDSLLQSLLVLRDARHEHERLSEIYTPLPRKPVTINNTT